MRARRFVIPAVVGVAVALRWWILTSRLRFPDSDESVVGLMALAIRHGDRPYFFWGQNYGGSIEAWVTALPFAITGASPVVLKLVPSVFAAAAAVVLWRCACRLVDERAAAFTGALLLITPPFFVWWSLKATSYYWAVLLFVVVVLLCSLRIADDVRAGGTASVVDATVLGLAAGLAWWASPQCLFVFVPLFAWLAFIARVAWRRVWLAALGFVVGSAPWLAWNARHDWDSLSFPPGLPRTTYMTRWRGFFTHALPQLMGVREPYAQNWRFGALGVACYLAALALVVVALVLVLRDRDRRRRLAPVVAITLTYPFLYAAPKTSWYMGEPRYMMLFIPIAVVAAGALGTTVWRQAGIGVLAVLLAVATVHDLDHYGETRSSVVFAYAPDTRSLVRVLDAHHVHAVFADYWIAYPLTFATDRRIVATPVDVVREHGIDGAVYATTPSTYVLYVHSDRDVALADDLGARGIGYDRIIVGQFAVFFCDRNVLPGSLSPGLWLTNGYSA